MTADFGGPTQLEKIDMLDFADLIAVNKADRRGSTDAARLVLKQASRGRRESAPYVVGTTASRYNDGGVNQLYANLLERLYAVADSRGSRASWAPAGTPLEAIPPLRVIPPAREHYLYEIAENARRYRRATAEGVEAVRRVEALEEAGRIL